MNEKRQPIEPTLDPDQPATRTRSDVAPKPTESRPAARHISGLRPAVHLPEGETPSVPPAPLTPEDLLEDGWDDVDDDDDSGPTLLDPHASVPPELVAQARAISDPIGEREPETREVATRELATTAFVRDEAPTGEMPTVSNPLSNRIPNANDVASPELHDDDEEFNHDDFPTRQTPMGLQEALLAFPLPTDSHRGLHETLSPAESTPEIAAPVAMSPDQTAQMPTAPALPRLEELSSPPPPVERSSVSQISAVSQISHPSYPSAASQSPRSMLVYPTPTSITGAPLPPANTVRFAFLRNLSPNDDPPASRLLLVATIAFCTTLLLSAFVAWIIVLVRH